MKQMILAAGLVAALATSAGAAIIISEVHPTGSSNGSYNEDFIELTNTGPSAVDITGWKMDDGSFNSANAVAIINVTSIAAGQSVVLAESRGANPCPTVISNFINHWFSGSAPSGFAMGCYQGSNVGLSSGGDGVVIFDSLNAVVTGVQFGASTTGVSFDNTAGIGSSSPPYPTISQTSLPGVNGAFLSPGSPTELGSPGVTPEPGSSILLCFAAAWVIRRSRK